MTTLDLLGSIDKVARMLSSNHGLPDGLLFRLAASLELTCGRVKPQ